MSPHFVKRVNKEIYDINNKPFLLRGVGIGGWLLFEGYMFKSFGKIDRATRFKNLVVHSTNQEFATTFFDQWYDTFITEDDIILVKKEGFNSIRVAIDYQFLFEANETEIELESIEVNFKRLDFFVSLCKKHGVYVIIDLHAAPGGQTGTNIDNSAHDRPELFENLLYQEQLCYIWKFIADRYKKENIIAAYDLLNEPLPNWNNKHNHKLVPLYKKVIDSIREVDKNHMITLEGLHWSTDWSCFTQLLDENILLQFHKYWSNPDIESIEEYIKSREKMNVPIFMGEGGENNLQWYYAVFKLYEQMNISFNFWTYKKMNNHNSIISFTVPKKWSEFLQGSLSKTESMEVLHELLSCFQFKNCQINQDVINHVLHKNNLCIPAYGFDYKGDGVSSSSKNRNMSSFRKSDNISVCDRFGNIVKTDFKQYSGEEYNKDNQLYIKLSKGDWVVYSFHLDNKASFFKIAVDASSKEFKMSLNNTVINIDKEYETKCFDTTLYEVRIEANNEIYVKNITVKITK